MRYDWHLIFCSTGNSLYIAQRVKKALGGLTKYIPNYEGDGSEFEEIILVTPIYSYGMPTFVYDIIPRINKMTELIIIQNYGGMVSGADYFIYQYAKEQGLNIKAVYVLKMPENFTTTFTVPKFYIINTLKSADKRIDNVINSINLGDYRVPKKCKIKRKIYFKNKSNWKILRPKVRLRFWGKHCAGLRKMWKMGCMNLLNLAGEDLMSC